MKKSKILKSVSLVALSAVMVTGSVAALAGCKGKGSGTYEIRINIFCDATDAATNKKICLDWAEEYQQKCWENGTIPNGQKITITFDNNTDKNKYFEDLNNNFSRGASYVEDVIYMAPKYTQEWVRKNRIMDLSPYLQSEDAIENINGVWTNAISFFGYANDDKYTLGDAVEYNANGANGAGWYTSEGVKTGLYAMPKDYSNFSMGFNNRYFSEALRYAYTNSKATDSRTVKGRIDNPALNTYTGSGDEGVVFDPVTKQDCEIIRIGKPTTYMPYNFYAFPSFTAALDAGDPVATASFTLTEGKGYTVTIPGWPGDTFTITDDDATTAGYTKDANAPYDANIGHVVYTYSEYSALTWAVTYYCNTFNWQEAKKGDLSKTTSGTGGMTMANSKGENVYGSDQYEGAPNATLYLLPWLAGNDANFISTDSQKAVQPEDKVPTSTKNMTPAQRGGTASEKVSKLRLDGSMKDVDVQYGVNSERFIETYGAFLAYGSDWNGNSGNARSQNTVKEDNGWSLFRDGALLFYGAGTWDSKTKNESSTEFCEFRQMPMPISDRYSIYSSVKNAYYQMEQFAWDPANNTYKHNGDASYKTEYSESELKQYLIDRQDKWAARMDSVGYAANKTIEALKGTDGEWKIQGVVDLILELTANEEDQRDLTYGGAQLPNFRQSCIDFLNYQSKDEKLNKGTFKDMITPEGFSTTKYYNEDGSVNAEGKAEAEAIWSYYIGVVEEMQAAYTAGERTKTIGQFLAGKKDYNGQGEIRYDKQFENTTFSEFTGERAQRAFIMKIFRMVTHTRADRDLNMRMQYGVNSVRDSAMYTYQDAWINVLTMRQGGIAFAYNNQALLLDDKGKLIDDMWTVIATDPNPATTEGLKNFQTPAVFCFRSAEETKRQLDLSISNEKRALAQADRAN